MVPSPPSSDPTYPFYAQVACHSDQMTDDPSSNDLKHNPESTTDWPPAVDHAIGIGRG